MLLVHSESITNRKSVGSCRAFLLVDALSSEGESEYNRFFVRSSVNFLAIIENAALALNQSRSRLHKDLALKREMALMTQLRAAGAVGIWDNTCSDARTQCQQTKICLIN